MRLGWRVQRAQVQPGVEIAWQFTAAHGGVTQRVRRLTEGPADIRRVRIACTLEGKLGTLNLVAENGSHLTVVSEGTQAAPRTLSVPPQKFAEMIARQLSDRERDPVFRESMAVAGAMAQRVIG